MVGKILENGLSDMILSIIIVSYKSKNLVRESILSIQKLKFVFEYEIIVVDNNSKYGVEKMIKENFLNIKFIQSSKNVGMGAGNNLGMRVAQGKYILILNPDTLVLKGSIEKLIHFMDTHSRSGIVAPMLINPDYTDQPTVHRFPSFLMPLYRRTFLGSTKKGREYLSYYTVAKLPKDKPSKVDWVFAPVFLIRNDLARKLGGYDERFFLFFEDTDICRRVWQAGFEVWYAPLAKIVHFPHRLSAHNVGLYSLFKRFTWYHIISWFKYFWKWRDK